VDLVKNGTLDPKLVRRAARILFLCGGSLSSLIAAVLFVLAGIDLHHAHAFLASAVSAEGVIEGAEATSTSSGEGSTDIQYMPLIGYTDARGVKHSRVRARVSRPEKEMGARVSLLYDPSNPNEIWVPAHGWIYAAGIGIVGIGTTPLGAAIACFFVVWVLRRPRSDAQPR
jgi:hypothetical protein